MVQPRTWTSSLSHREKSGRESSPGGSWISFIVLFPLIFFGLAYLYQQARGTCVERFLVDDLTVRPAVVLINLVLPGSYAIATGHTLSSHGISMDILQGCEGTEIMFLLVAAVLAFRSPWRKKAAGIAVGIALVYVLNQLRLLALFAALRDRPTWFASLHGLVGPSSLMFLGCLFFLIWASAATRHA
jgi:exosortase family protein XrtM